MNSKVYIVDDDPSVRDALMFLLDSVGIESECFGSAGQFLESHKASMHGCLLLDIRMPGLNGLELQQKLSKIESVLPVIVLTGHGEVSMAVRAVQAGAVDFLEKPFDEEKLLCAIDRGLALGEQIQAKLRSQQAARRRLALLSDREREVLSLFVDGNHTKQVAKQLHISEKTVAAHRSRLYEKLRVDSVVEMVHLAAHVDAFEPKAPRVDLADV